MYVAAPLTLPNPAMDIPEAPPVRTQPQPPRHLSLQPEPCPSHFESIMSLPGIVSLSNVISRRQLPYCHGIQRTISQGLREEHAGNWPSMGSSLWENWRSGCIPLRYKRQTTYSIRVISEKTLWMPGALIFKCLHCIPAGLYVSLDVYYLAGIYISQAYKIRQSAYHIYLDDKSFQCIFLQES